MTGSNNIPISERFTSEFAIFTQQALPASVRSISLEGDNFIIIRLKYGKPFDEVLVHYSDDYKTHYPHGNITFVINGYMRGMPAAASPTFARICSTLSSLAKTTSQEGNDILSLFPIKNDEDEKKNNDGFNTKSKGGMMGSRSNSNAAGGGGGMHNALRQNSLTEHFRKGSQWHPEPTMEVDVSLEAVKLNKKLTDDLARLEAQLSPPTTAAATQNEQQQQNAATTSSSSASTAPIISIQNLEAGHVAVCFTATIRQFADLYYRKARSNIQDMRNFNKILEALEMSREESFTFRLTLDPVQYPQGFCKVEFGQASNFAKGVFPGAVGHLRRILQTYIRTTQRLLSGDISKNVSELLLEGFGEEEITKALETSNQNLGKAREVLTKESGQFVAPTSSSTAAAATNSAKEAALKIKEAKRVVPPQESGLLLGCLRTVVKRLDSLSEFCCICDQTHVFANVGASSQMCGSTVCTRGSCLFRYNKLDVAKDVATQSAMQTGVMDLLIVLTRFAALSSRWNLIFDPFPTLVDDKGVVVCSPANKNIELCKNILTNFPIMKTLSQSESQGAVTERLRQHHPLAQTMMNWILGSNRAVLTKLNPQQTMTLFGSKHQFRLIMQSPEREQKFQELKAKHGAKWAFHGSRTENWFSIMRNGLRNYSGKNGYQLTGAAYGSGVYLSCRLMTSASYSQVSGNQSQAVVDKHLAEEFLDPSVPINLMAICEVANDQLKIATSDIWVAQNEDTVVTRFLIVYTHGFFPTADIRLDQPVPQRILNECLAFTEM